MLYKLNGIFFGIGVPFLFVLGEWDTRHPEVQKLFLIGDGKPVWDYDMPLHPSPGANQEFDDITMLPDGNIVTVSGMISQGGNFDSIVPLLPNI